MSLVKSDMRDKAFRIVRDYLNGVWKQIAPQDMVLKRISGGLSNFLYYCALPSSLKPNQGEPSRVLVRFYGQIHGEGALEALLTESVIFTLLSERRLGPKLHGVFPGGRLEEFIPARPLKTKELADTEISSIIGEKMAQIHTLQVPISKEPTWLWETMNRWLSTATKILATPVAQDLFVDERGVSLDGSPAARIRSRFALHLDTEMEWLRRFLKTVHSPVVFCHNDLQEGNILIRENATSRQDKLVIIDFEYCSYNYRAFDFANHFCEWTMDYTVEKHPKFSVTLASMPSLEQRLHFIRSYLETSHREAGTVPEAGEEERLLREADCFVLASHFFWALWSVVNAPASAIPFGYWEYAESRFGAYFQHKEQVLRKYGNDLEVIP